MFGVEIDPTKLRIRDKIERGSAPSHDRCRRVTGGKVVEAPSFSLLFKYNQINEKLFQSPFQIPQVPLLFREALDDQRYPVEETRDAGQIGRFVPRAGRADKEHRVTTA